MPDAGAQRPRLLVVGATGMLGHMACRTLAGAFDVRATCRRAWRDHPGLASVIDEERCVPGCDAADAARLRSVFAELRPAVVLNCVGVIKQKKDARDAIQCIGLNALLPHQLASWCDEFGARLVHVSTDCVFSGARGGYRESDVPDCVDLYGRSKLLGEVDARPHLTLRTSLIGRQLCGRESLVEWFVSQRGGRVRGFSRAIFSGLTTRALCRVIGRVLVEAPQVAGLYHVASAPISKLELLVRLNRILDLGVAIDADDSLQCDRSLDGGRFARDAGVAVPSWDRMLEELGDDCDIYAPVCG